MAVQDPDVNQVRAAIFLLTYRIASFCFIMAFYL